MTIQPPTTQQLPGAPGLPIFGNLVDLARDPIGFVVRLQEEYGDIAPFSLGRGKPTILLSDPQLIKQVLLESGKRYSKGKMSHAVRTVLGNGLVMSEGELWKRQRKLVAPAFAHQSLGHYADLMVAYTSEMMEGWAHGMETDLYKEMTLLTQRIIMKALFNVDVKGSAREAGEAFDAMMRGLGAEMNGLDAILPPAVPTPTRRQMTKAVAFINEMLYDLVERRRSGEDASEDLLSMLMAARDEAGAPMSIEQLLDEMRTLYIAGHETTATTLAWSWYLLAEHPEVAAKLEGEIDAVLGGRAPTVEDVARLSYCNALFREALRCYPTAWVFQRMALEEVELGGVTIPAETRIWISPWVVHHDARWYDEPERFLPERWLAPKEAQPVREAYIPFGGGPRICIGNGFAMMEGVLLLATMMQRFRVERLLEPPVEIGVAGSLFPKHGIPVRLVARRG